MRTTSGEAAPEADGSSSMFRLAARTHGMRPSAIREILKITESPDVISFAGGLPAPELFPIELTARAAAHILAEDGPAALQYSTTEGYRPLRDWVSEHLAANVGLHANADQVLITNGSQQGLDLVAKVLLDPGDVVLVENPGYLGALQAFHAYEADIVGVESDAGGICIDRLRTALAAARRRPKFLYLIPDFQNPTGVSLAGGRRGEVVRLAAQYGVPIVEDDPYGRLRFSGESRPALSATTGADAGWIYLGTTSKILAPGLRVAWIVASDVRMRERLVTAKQAADLHTSTFTQRLAFACVRPPGELETHVGRLCAVYQERRDAMLAALERTMPAGCAWTRPQGGLFLWVTLPAMTDAIELLKSAARERVAFVPGEPFWVGSPRRNTMRLNFSNASVPRIEEGIARLAAVIKASPGGG